MERTYCDMNEIIPCNNCICVPICRHKKYDDMYGDCTLLRKFLRRASESNTLYVYVALYDTLEPTTWNVGTRTKYTIPTNFK